MLFDFLSFIPLISEDAYEPSLADAVVKHMSPKSANDRVSLQ